MKRADSGHRGVLWHPHPQGSQKFTLPNGKRPAKGHARRGERGDWWVRWACPHGHLHRERIGPKSLAIEQSQRRRLERPCPARDPRPTSYLLADIVREYVESAKRTKRSWKNDERYGLTWIERLGGRALEEITAGELEKFRTERLAVTVDVEDGTTRQVTPATVNREFAFLKHVYNVAIRDEKVNRNPVAQLRMLREPSGRVRYLTDAEEIALREQLATDAERDRLTVLVQTGLRKSEFLGLRWKDLDLKVNVLTIPRSKNGETRHVPMTSDVRGILGRLPRALAGTALVFPNSEGGRDLRWAEKTFPKAVTDAKLANFRLHDTRHTFASRLAMAGVDVLTIKDLGGWKSLAMVARYAHLSPSHRRDAIERLVAPRSAPKQTGSGGAE